MDTHSKFMRQVQQVSRLRLVLCSSLWVAITWGPNCWSADNHAKNATMCKTKITQAVNHNTFMSAGHSIRTEWFYSAKSTSNPTVIILPGSGGIEETGGFFRDMASSLSNCGINAVIVHYMDRSGIAYANNAQMGANFGKWLQTISDGIKFVQRQPGIDPKRVSILGHSLGAQLALHAVASNPAVISVVDMAGCFVLPTDKIARMPPVLILHGSADRVVPLSRERQLIAVLKRAGRQYQEHIFKNADHAFANVSEAELFSIISKFLKEPSPQN